MSLSSCLSSFQQPKLLSISKVKLKSMNLKELEIDFCTRIHNPNHYSIKLLSVNADVFFDGKLLGSIQTDTTLILSKGGISEINTSIQSGLNQIIPNILPLINILQQHEPVRITLNGKLRVKARGIRKSLSLDYSENVSL